MPSDLGTILAGGAGTYALQLVQATGQFPTIPQAPEESAPLFTGSVAEFLTLHKEDVNLVRQMKNKVKVCQCGKPNAFTLPNCNSCSATLANTAITFTNNVFMSFVYGIAPIKISMRIQSPDLLCFDDLLQLSVCHLNVIPTTQYIPDWRFLLKNPEQGLKMLAEMFDTCFKAFADQFYANPEWRKKMLKGNPSLEELKSHVIAGMNYPPSQYQLHLQFMVPPMVPFHFTQYLNGAHYTPRRFFPLEYIRQVLAVGDSPRMTDDWNIDDIIWYYKGKGVDYDAIHAACYAKYGASHRALANWSTADFSAVAVDGSNVYNLATGAPMGSGVLTDIVKQDKDTIQSYGRPYANGKPTGTFYKHAKKSAAEVAMW